MAKTGLLVTRLIFAFFKENTRCLSAILTFSLSAIKGTILKICWLAVKGLIERFLTQSTASGSTCMDMSAWLFIILTGQNKLSPMSIFFHRCNVNMSKLSHSLPKERKQLKCETQQQHLRCNFTVSVESFHCLSICVEFSMGTLFFFANFTVGMIGNETWLLLKFVDFSRQSMKKVKPSTFWEEILLLICWNCFAKIAIH